MTLTADAWDKAVLLADVWLLECNLPPCLGSQTSSCQSSETAVARLVQPQLEALARTFGVGNGEVQVSAVTATMLANAEAQMNHRLVP